MKSLAPETVIGATERARSRRNALVSDVDLVMIRAIDKRDLPV